MLSKRENFQGNAKGFSILEVVIAMGVFSVGILGMATLQTRSINNNVLAETAQGNIVAAMELTEAFLAMDYTDQHILNDGTVPFTAADKTYTGTITAVNNSAIPNAKLVTVVSQFTPRGGRPQSVTLRCFKPFVK